MSLYFAILTAVGEAKLANAAALGTVLNLTQMAVGDGNGATPVPVRTQLALVNEKRRAALNRLDIDPLNPSQIIVEQVLPENVGGWWIRELGIYDQDGDLCAVANCPPSYKPELSEGSGRTQVVRMVLIVSSTTAVQLKIDPAVVLATRKYADDVVVASMSTHVAAADPHPQYATDADLTAHVAAADPHQQYVRKVRGIADYDNATAYALNARTIAANGKTYKCIQAGVGHEPSASPTYWELWGYTATDLNTVVQAAVTALVNASPAALDTLSELAAALGNDANFATTVTNALALRVAKDSATGAASMPIGTTAQRKAVPIAGDARVNSTLGNILELYSGTGWGAVGKIKQVVYARANSSISTTTTVNAISAGITPTASSRVLIIFFVGLTANGGTSNCEAYMTLRDNLGAFMGGDYSMGDGANVNTMNGTISGFYIDTPGSAATKTYTAAMIVGSAGTASLSTATRERGMLLLEIE